MFLMLFISCAWSVTRHVRQDGLGDFTLIQSAIIAASSSDTVLVYPGRYLENIDFSGRNITVASLQLTTGDSNYIGTTIIDGQRLGSCVRVMSGELSARLVGFSITNGSGEYYFYAYEGGGIIVGQYSTLSLENCRVFQNETESGGGLFARRATVYLSGTSFYNNLATSGGGGICLEGDTVSFTMDAINRCNIYNNYSGQGTDFLCWDLPQIANVVVDTFTVINPNRYYAQTVVNFIADTYGYSFDIQNGFLSQINHDLYISTTGNDQNDGLSPQTPYKTIAWAMHHIVSDSLNPKTIYVLDGVYSTSINEQKFPISGKSFVTLQGQSQENTIFNGDDRYFMLSVPKQTTEFTVKKMSFTDVSNSPAIAGSRSTNINFVDIQVSNCTNDNYPAIGLSYINGCHFTDVKIIQNTGIGDCSGISLIGVHRAYIENCLFSNNQAYQVDWDQGGALKIQYADSIFISNCRFLNNTDDTQYGGAALVLSGPQFDPGYFKLVNCLFSGNQSTYSSATDVGCPIVVSGYSVFNFNNCTFADNFSPRATLLVCADSVNLTNCVFADSSNYEVFLSHPFEPNVPDNHIKVAYTNMKSGNSGILNQDGWGIISWLDGNIDTNPLFDISNLLYPYSIQAGSPCIDAGTPDTTSLFLPIADLAGNYRIWNNRIDMGCYEYGSEPVGNEDHIYEEMCVTLNNYPNPFNPSTTIFYNLPACGQVELNIYNIRGQFVRKLVNEKQTMGHHTITWNGKDGKGRPLASGMYLCHINFLGKHETKKMILLK